jgi:hypothetical protein
MQQAAPAVTRRGGTPRSKHVAMCIPVAALR